MFDVFWEEQMFGVKLPMGERNFKNTPKRIYNCGGYALGTYNWYCPWKEEENEYYNAVLDVWECSEKDLQHFVEVILEEFKDNIRIISNISELQKGEYAIAFRIACDDFHFIKRGKNGHWYSKMGDSSHIDEVSEEYVFASSWEGFFRDYDSKLILFAKKG